MSESSVQMVEKSSSVSINLDQPSNESSKESGPDRFAKSYHLYDPNEIYEKIKETLENFCEKKIKENNNLKQNIEKLRNTIQEIIYEKIKNWEKVIDSITGEIEQIKEKLNLNTSNNSSQSESNNSFVVKTLNIKEDIISIKNKIYDLMNKNLEIDLSYILLDNNLMKTINKFNEFYKDKIDNYKKLNLSYNNIKDIKPLESLKLRNIEILVLSNNKIVDISYLKNTDFPHLKKLGLYNNEISDIKSLKDTNFNNLEVLSLSYNKIEDITILDKLNFIKLKVLNLGNNYINDVSPLKKVKFENLEKLGLNNNKIKTIDFLENEHFTKLKEIYLENNLIEDVNIFGKVNSNKFNNLEKLSLSENRIKDISCLNKPDFINLKELYLNNNIELKNVLNENKFAKVKIFFNGNE